MPPTNGSDSHVVIANAAGVQFAAIVYDDKLDGCIVWNAYDTALGSKRLAVCATV